MIADANETVTHLWAPLVALLAGFVSFASPCVLPLVPGYLSFVTGESVTDEGRGRWHRLAPILLFVAGFTVMFTLGRLPGWIAHWLEQRNDPDGYRIHRPRQIYTGETQRVFEDWGTKRL